MNYLITKYKNTLVQLKESHDFYVQEMNENPNQPNTYVMWRAGQILSLENVIKDLENLNLNK